MRVLAECDLEGDRGCIGAVLVPMFLRAAGHKASGRDLGRREGRDLEPAPADIGARACATSGTPGPANPPATTQ